MAITDQARKELKEKCDQQQPDMHPIHIRICSNHHISVPEIIQVFFNIQCGLQKVEFFIFVYDLFSKTVRI